MSRRQTKPAGNEPLGTVLVVDDEAPFLSSLAERIELKGYRTLTAETGADALDLARSNHLDLAIVDQRLPDIEGLSIMARLKEIHPGLRTVLLTGHGDEKLRQATESLDAGYFEKDQMSGFWDFISRFRDRPGMIIIPPGGGEADGTWPGNIEFLAAGETLQRRRHGLLPEDDTPGGRALARIIGETPTMQELKETISKVAGMDCTVLLLGETGTGKEMVARTIHDLSPRGKHRFLAANCGAFSQDLLSNELFGHDKEAFTGAHHTKKGLFEAAAGGTILLDEVGDTPPSMQVQLLRVLQEKTITRVGSTTEIPVDVRVLAATNRDLKKDVAAGRFREDLYYRLNVFTVRIPPLRERRDDIELLASFFLGKYRRTFGKPIEGFTDEVMDILLGYSFPGNVRELANVVERAVILCESGSVERRHLPERLRDAKAVVPVQRGEFVSLAELEREYIIKVLASLDNNKSEAAKVLGINRASLWRKLKKYEEDGLLQS